MSTDASNSDDSFEDYAHRKRKAPQTADQTANEISDEIPGELHAENTESMAFLQGLNSGNLMTFSQQSVLHDLMLQEIKPQINTLPILENHNNGGYDFSMDLKEPPKSLWLFSKPLNKLYIRMNKTFNIDVEFKAKMPIQPLNLRVFLCFVKEVSGPVLRCQNHLSADPLTENAKLRESLLRCENPATQYCGTADGKSVADRYSVLIPLNMCRVTYGNTVRQTLAFKFTCQNSCFGRKETCLVFCLENISGYILGQQILYVKICTCPKRDRNLDERNIQSTKRKGAITRSDDEEADIGVGMKMRRVSLKEELESKDSCDIDLTMSENWEVSATTDGAYRLAVSFPTHELLLQSIDGMIEKTATAMLFNTENSKQLRQHASGLLLLKKRALNLV